MMNLRTITVIGTAICSLSIFLIACSDPAAETAPAAPPAAVEIVAEAEAPKPAEVDAAVVAKDAATKPEEQVLDNWDPQAIRIIEELALKLQDAGVACTEFSVAHFGSYTEEYLRIFRSVPAAQGSCISDDEEDLTFAAFKDAAAARQFAAAKQRYLCLRAKEIDLKDFPGIPLIIGDRWIIEPDEMMTATRIAPLVGGTARLASCAEGDSVANDALPESSATNEGVPRDPTSADLQAQEGVLIVFAEAEPDFGTAPLTITFTVYDPYHRLGEPEISWDFGDGNTSDRRKVVHTYEKPGDYVVKLRVVEDGAEDEDEMEITVDPPEEAPAAPAAHDHDHDHSAHDHQAH